MGCAQVCERFLLRRQPKSSETDIKQNSNAQSMQVSPASKQLINNDQQYLIAQELANLQPVDLRAKFRLSRQQMKRKYRESKGNQKIYFESLSEDITNYYMELTKIHLQSITSDKMSQSELKVQFSEQVLQISLDIFDIMGAKNNYQFTTQTFRYFNSIQGELIGYIKMKYPRAGNIFIPGGFAQKFKDIDRLGNDQVDVLKNANIFFTNSSKVQVVNTLKQFFNKLINQLDEKFPKFKKLLQQKIFSIPGQGNKLANYKIGRKIPQNINKFDIDNTEQLTIASPELFRTIIKWISCLQKQFQIPQIKLKQRETFKFYQVKQKLNDECYIEEQILNYAEVEDIVPMLLEKFMVLKEFYKNQLESLREEIDTFNISLLKILFTTQRKQKYVPKAQANVIKYSFYNTKVVSWMVVEMLILLIQKLILIGKQVRYKDRIFNINLINFSIADLLRARVVGTKKQISSIFSNVLDLEKQGEIKIVKIKNRLGTLLNDAMIIFTMKDTFLICELQLILSQGQSTSIRLKNIEFMNHFLYQLQRSPYGLLSQSAVILGYKDSKISYAESIGFVQGHFFSNCQTNHPKQIVKQQMQPKPIICMTCSQFYNPHENMFSMKKCKRCLIFQCCMCSCRNKQQKQLAVDKAFKDSLESRIFIKSQTNAFLMIFVKKLFIDQKLQLSSICNQIGEQVLGGKQLHSFLQQKKYLKFINYQELQKNNQKIFLLVQFKGSSIKIRQFYWNKEIEQFQNCYKVGEVISQMKQVNLSQFDFISFFQTQKMIIISQKSQQKEKIVFLSIQKQPQRQIVQRYYLIPFFSSFGFLLRFERKNYKSLEGVNISSQVLAKKRRFENSSLVDKRKQLPEIMAAQQNFSMPNQGITSPLIEDYFTKTSFEWKSKIKQINLSDNLIIDPKSIFQSCSYATTIILSKNFIKFINFYQYNLCYLSTLIIGKNLISDIKGLEKLTALQKLKIDHNQIMNLESINLGCLRQLNFSYNNFDSLQWLQQSRLPNVKIIQASSSGISMTENHQSQSLSFNFPNILEFFYNDNKTGYLTLNCQLIQYFSANNCQLRRVYVPLQKIVNLSICDNDLQNLDDILNVAMPIAKIIKCNNAGNLPILPKIKAQKLVELHLENCKITNAIALGSFKMPQIEQINLSRNQDIQKIPDIKLPKLKRFNTVGLRLQTINFLQKSQVSSLQQLKLNGQLKLLKLSINEYDVNSTLIQPKGFSRFNNYPYFSIKTIKSLQLSNFSFKNFKNISLSPFPNLQQLVLIKLFVDQLPKLQICSLKLLNLIQVYFLKMSCIEQSQFPNLKKLLINRSNIKCPQLLNNKQQIEQIQFASQYSQKFQSLPPVLKTVKILTIKDCGICNLEPFLHGRIQNIKIIDLTQNKLQYCPTLKFKNLNRLILKKNQIKQIVEFSKSELSKLEYVDFSYNSIAKIPAFDFPNLKQFIIDFNPVEDLSDLIGCKLSQLQQFRLIALNNIKNNQLPILDLPKAKKVILFHCNIQNLDKISNWHLPEVQQLIIGSWFEIKLPVLKFQRLQVFKCCNTGKLKNEQIDKLVGEFTRQQTWQRQNFKVSRTNSIKMYVERQDEEDIVSRQDDIMNMGQWDCLNLKIIQIKNLHLKSFPKVQILELETLAVRQCHLQDMQDFKQSDLPLLQNLIIQHVRDLHTFEAPQNIVSGGRLQIKQSDVQVVNGLHNIKCKQIILRSNKINKIESVNLNQTQILDISQNRLQNTEFMTTAPKLKVLNLTCNNINILPSIVFPQLTDLIIAVNNLTYLKLQTENFPNLERIQCSRNQIETVENIRLQSLQKFSCSQNSIKSIDFFGNSAFNSVSSIDFESNQITHIENLPKTKQFNISLNPLGSINWLNKVDTSILQILVIVSAEIQDFRIFGTFDHKFDQLIKLDLSNNSANSFPTLSSSFPKLQQLDLSNNNFAELTRFPVHNFPVLQKINLNGNFLKKFQIQLTNIKYIFLNNNQLEYINLPSNVQQIVRQIQVDYNNLKDINFMSKCPRLSKISAKNNQILSLPDISSNYSLKKLLVPLNPLINFEAFLTSKFDELDPIEFEYSTDSSLTSETVEQIKRTIQQKQFQVIKKKKWA